MKRAREWSGDAGMPPERGHGALLRRTGLSDGDRQAVDALAPWAGHGIAVR